MEFIDILSTVNKQLSKLNINYEFGRMSRSPPKYPYWVGDYTEAEPMTEDGQSNFTFILTGFARGNFIDLEREKNIIKSHFEHGISVLTENNVAVVIFYAGSLNIPVEDADLKKCQINLKIKSWKGM